LELGGPEVSLVSGLEGAGRLWPQGPEVSLVSGLEGAGRLWPQETAGARWLGRKPMG